MALALLAAGPSGCGLTRRVAVSSMVPILEETVDAVYRDMDVETVGRGLPANLLLLRGLCESDRGNRTLWTLTTQLYFYYGFGFVEAEEESAGSRGRPKARLVYRAGLDLGVRALSRRDWFRPESGLDSFKKGLARAKREDVPLLFWTAANWASWINLQLNDPAAIADLPLAEAAMQRVLELDPTYFHGMPHVMAGTLQATKPVLMGGNPEEARKHFEEAFRISDRKLLIFQTLYAQYYCRQTLDEQGFVDALNEVLKAPSDLAPDYRLLNEVARRRAGSLMERKDDWF